mmetsp:Transcript_15421/g.23916  ORF Transcript_15421/g.23916 Transcript_15421/m.23916 type:complete len:394 (+) Transcript_15421:59-1240(+)
MTKRSVNRTNLAQHEILPLNIDTIYNKKTSQDILLRYRRRKLTGQIWTAFLSIVAFSVCGTVILQYFFIQHSKTSVREKSYNADHILDWKLASVKHWCRSVRMVGDPNGGEKEIDCQCEDPLVPTHSTAGRESWWMDAHDWNVQLFRNFTAEGGAPSPGEDTTSKNGTRRELDVVFLGDSITMRWNARNHGGYQEEMAKNKVIFEELFENRACALGISGDTGPNLLWRIQNGEMPSIASDTKGVNTNTAKAVSKEEFGPKIWWLLVGINDLRYLGCSEEIVMISIERVVEEIQLRKSINSTVVLNGLLPSSEDEHGRLGPLWESIQKINAELQEHAKKSSGDIRYFDAGSLFLSGERYIDSDLMPDFLHPSSRGFKKWGNAIKKEIDSILKKP